MDSFWKAALAVGGVAAIGAFVFWSLYKDWLALPIFSKMTPEQTFQIMKMFLWFVFACFVVSAASYVAVKKDSHRSESKEISDSEKGIPSLAKNDNQENEQLVNFILQLSPLIFDLIIFGEQEKDRIINPWASELKSRYEKIANKLRKMSVQDVAIQEGWKENLNRLAGFVDKFVNSKKHKCIGGSLSEEIKDVVENATFLKEEKIDPFFASQRIPSELMVNFKENIRLVNNYTERSDGIIKRNNVKKLQGEISKAGYFLLKFSMYNTKEFPESVKEKLHDIAKKMHLLEIEENFNIDKQESFRKRLDELCGQLNALAVEMT